ncbi:Predicted membrane protein [Mycobacteroides abscessus subsp. massiliense]|nr:Predicted membrane protein [Mycobacteroides abscessus subsp. massiliense]
MMSLSNIFDRLKTYTARNIIITGGEPTIQPHLDTLLNALKAEGYFLCIETNGLNPAPSQIDYVATSPKACYAPKYVASRKPTKCVLLPTAMSLRFAKRWNAKSAPNITTSRLANKTV